MPRKLFTLKLLTQYWDNCDPDLKLVFYQHTLLTAFILLHIYNFALKYVLHNFYANHHKNIS